MKTIIALLLFMLPAYAGNNVTITSSGNNVTITSYGNTQTIQVTQNGYNQTANVNVIGNNPPPVTVTQSGYGKSIEINIICAVSCPTQPIVVNE